MNATWEIEGQVERALPLGRISLADAGVETATLELASFYADTLSWSQRSGTVPENLQEVSLFRDGVRVFTGHVTRRPYVYRKNSTPGYSITISGPLWWLENTQISAEVEDGVGDVSERAYIQFPPGDLAASVRRLIDLAAAAGLPIRAGHIDEMFEVQRQTFNGESYLSVLMKMLEPVADACTVVDYAADGVPTLNVYRRRGTMPANELALGLDDVVGISLTPREELKVTGVKVLSAARNSTGRFIFAEESAGAGGRPQIVTTSGPEIGPFIVPDNLPMVEIETAAIAGTWAEAIALNPSLAEYMALYPFASLAPGGSYSLYQTTNPFNDATNRMTAMRAKLTDVSTGVEVGATWHRILTGQVVDFLKVDYGLKECSLQFSGEFYAQHVGGIPDSPDWITALTGYLPRRGIGGYINNVANSQSVTYHLFKVEYTVPAISLSYPTKQKIYAKAAYEYLTPPPGLAMNLWQAQDWTPWEGDVSLNPGVPWRRWVASRLNILNGPEELRTAGALVQSQSVELETGAVSIRCGASARIGMDAVTGKYRQASSTDNIKIL